MKRLLVTFIFLFILAGGVFAASDNSLSVKAGLNSEANKGGANAGANVEAGEIIRERNRLRINASGECPQDCTCDGSATKCQIGEGREMTIRAGNSGNTVVQVKGVNMSTKVMLYKNNDSVYGVFKGNQTRRIQVMPDEVQERVRERIQLRLENMSIELDENGNYNVKARKRARLFGVLPVRERVQAEINAETGEVIRTRSSWWGFLAVDSDEESQ